MMIAQCVKHQEDASVLHYQDNRYNKMSHDKKNSVIPQWQTSYKVTKTVTFKHLSGLNVIAPYEPIKCIFHNSLINIVKRGKLLLYSDCQNQQRSYFLCLGTPPLPKDPLKISQQRLKQRNTLILTQILHDMTSAECLPVCVKQHGRAQH